MVTVFTETTDPGTAARQVRPLTVAVTLVVRPSLTMLELLL